ncbi:MAG: sugar ABC transporter permease [Oscillospiraceae bacterium]|jgi:multiple sugar transport system permease protein|nr:sugar ABC transporter permease [Oscillospiraceae bacterium]
MRRREKAFHWSLERGDLLPLLLMLPALLLVVFTMVIPLGYGLFLSLFNFNMGAMDLGRDFVGLGNYARMFGDAVAMKSIWNTVKFSLGAIAGDMLLGTLAAVMLFQLTRREAAFARPIVTMPLLISPIIISLMWRYIYDPQGILYYFLGKAGVTTATFPGLTGESTALLSIIIAHWWQVVPFYIIVLTAGLVSIPQELYEAAYVDGAGGLRAFRTITLPLLTKIYMVVLFISGVDTIKIFDLIYGLTGGGPNNSTISISIYAFNQAFSNVQMGYAMALSVLAMAVAFALFGIPFTSFSGKRR